ncbi:hypothetical protein SLE2022_021910 [Rubroshorea leprosula]
MKGRTQQASRRRLDDGWLRWWLQLLCHRETQIAQFSGVVDTQSSQEEKPAFWSVELEISEVFTTISSSKRLKKKKNKICKAKKQQPSTILQFRKICSRLQNLRD